MITQNNAAIQIVAERLGCLYTRSKDGMIRPIASRIVFFLLICSSLSAKNLAKNKIVINFVKSEG